MYVFQRIAIDYNTLYNEIIYLCWNKLIYQFNHSSMLSFKFGRTVFLQVYVDTWQTGKKCVIVVPGDRLGVYMDEGPGSIVYKFLEKGAQTLGHFVTNLSDPTAIDDVVDFNSPIFPYLFSAAAYIDTGEWAGSRSSIQTNRVVMEKLGNMPLQ